MRNTIKCIGLAVLLTVCGAHMAQAQTQTISLDNAIRGAVEEFSLGLRRGGRVAVLAVRADYSLMSDYLIDELNRVLAGRQFTVVERGRLDQLQDEYDFRTFGGLSESSAQAIGRRLDAQAIVTGRFEPFGNSYRFRARVFEVGSTGILAAYSANVQNDQTVASLMREEEIAATEAAPSAASAAQAAPAAAAPPAVVAAPAAPVVVPSAPAKSSRSYDGNFTPGQRWGTWALNQFVLPGLGSYAIMRDTVGGTVQLMAGGVGHACLAAGTISWMLSDLFSIGYKDPNAIIFGLLLSIPNDIFNIVRSATYQKSSPKAAALFNPDVLNIAVVPGLGGIEGVQVSYNIRF